MDAVRNTDYERFLVYPNESIDKLTVNRAFERIFDEVEAKVGNCTLSLSAATQFSYGKARFSSLSTYAFDEPASTDEDYDHGMLTIAQLGDMSDRMSDDTCESLFAAPLSSDGSTSLPISSNRFWVKVDYMRSRFLFMPNGVNVITCSFDLGFNGLTSALSSSDIVDSDVVAPIRVSEYGDMLDVDSETYWNIEDFINDNNGVDGVPNPTDARNLMGMDGLTLGVPFMEAVDVTLRHNDCASTKYSAYKQSYIELCMSMKLSVKSLFDSDGGKFGKTTYEILDDSSETYGDVVVGNRGEIGRGTRLFTQRPTVMAQIGFYNNESNPSPLIGYDNGTSSESPTSVFSSHSRMSQKPLDEVDVDGCSVSPVNGCVLVKKVENVYDYDGNVVDNVVTLDVVMKFMAGSATDPEMDYAMNILNSRSRVQLAMIGV